MGLASSLARPVLLPCAIAAFGFSLAWHISRSGLRPAAGLPWAIMYGLGFGLGRSAPALAAVVAYRKKLDAGEVAAFLVASVRQPLRYVAVATAAIGVVSAVSLTWLATRGR